MESANGYKLMKAHVQRVTPSGEVSWVYRVKADERFSRGWHYHPEVELTWIQSSQGRRFVGDSVENYRSGDLVLLGSNLPHTWRSEDLAGVGREEHSSLHRAIVIQFSRTFLGEDFFRVPELGGVAALLDLASRGVLIEGATRDAVVERLAGMGRMSRFDRLLELLRVLGMIAAGGKDLRVLCRTDAVGRSNLADRRRIDRIFAHLHEHYAGVLAQAEVASLVKMSPAGFSRFFKKATGMTFVDYLAELRISQACTLLIDTDLSILEISGRAGFNNLSNFNRRFMKCKGMTPREYRRRHLGRQGD